MPDITMCVGQTPDEVCPIKNSCKRYLSKPNPDRQSYFCGLPFDHKKRKCNHYWGIGK